METNKEKIKEVQDQIAELAQTNELENIVKNNKIEFDYEGITYRVRKPNMRESKTINEQRTLKYMELLKDDNYMLEDQLIETYKKKGVDLNEIQSEIIALQRKQDEILLRLVKSTNKKEIGQLKDEVYDLRDQQIELISHKNQYLNFSIERKASEHTSNYLAYLLFEKKVEDKWERAFENYEAFLNNENENLILRVAYFISILVNSNEA